MVNFLLQIREGIMTKVSNPAAYVAVITAFSLLGIGACFPVDGARADDCAAAPSASAPLGEHWYYRSDRASRRKCWYLHATVQLPHHALAQSADAAAEPAQATPASQPPAVPVEPARAAATPARNAEPAAAPPANPPAAAGQADSAQPAPHVTVLAVRTVTTPFVSSTPAPPLHVPENVNTPPGPQTLPGEENAAANSVKPTGGAATTQLPPVPEAVRHELATTINAANATTQTSAAEMFFLLALTLGLAVIVIVTASRIANRRQAPRLSDDPDTAWLRYRAVHARFDKGDPYEEQDVPFVDPQEQHGLADLHEQHWNDQPSPGLEDYPAVRCEDGAGYPVPAETVAPSLRDIQLALRVLRQARQSRVA
jgi:hypothetical protein